MPPAVAPAGAPDETPAQDVKTLQAQVASLEATLEARDLHLRIAQLEAQIASSQAQTPTQAAEQAIGQAIRVFSRQAVIFTVVSVVLTLMQLGLTVATAISPHYNVDPGVISILSAVSACALSVDRIFNISSQAAMSDKSRRTLQVALSKARNGLVDAHQLATQMYSELLVPEPSMLARAFPCCNDFTTVSGTIAPSDASASDSGSVKPSHPSHGLLNKSEKV
jgi:hypothetical protein